MVKRLPVLLALIVTLCLTLTACTQKPMLAPSFEVPMKDRGKLHEIIREALVSRNWIILRNEPTSFEAEYRRTPEISARIKVKHIGGNVTISLLDSRGLDHNPHVPGKGPTIHRSYNNWVTNLEKDIQRLVGARL